MKHWILLVALVACRAWEEDVPPRMPRSEFYVEPKARDEDGRWIVTELAIGAVSGVATTSPP